jgi:hypothetical protein
VHIALVCVLLTAPLFGAATTDTFHWSGNVPAGHEIEIRGINGNIHAQPARGDSVDVIAYKSGRAIDPATIGVKVVEHDGGVTILAMPEVSAPAAGDVNIDFTVSVPSGVRFVARTVNGLVEAKSLDADAEAHTVNGDVVLSTSGAAQGETVNGSITASVGKITSPLNFTTVNGAISLEVPRGASAHIRATTKNGPIRTDFRVPVRGQFPAQQAEGVIGCGGPELHLVTVNGSISVRRNKRFTKL